MVGQNSASAASVWRGPFWYVGSLPPNVTPTLRIGCKNEETKFAKERAGLSKLLNLKDSETVQKFFLEEIQLS